MHPCLLIELLPKGPFRFGPDSGARDQTDLVYHSDSLYSAITSAMAQLGALDEWLAATATATLSEVRLSSCFPRSSRTRFLPPPRTVWPPQGGSAKIRWKRARFVPVEVIGSLLRGETLTDDEWVVDAITQCLLPTDRNSVLPPFRITLRARCAVDRLGAGVEQHATACMEFAPGAGLWCVVAFANDDAREVWKDRVRAAFRVLADSGVGGERTHGWGAFEWTATEASDVARAIGLTAGEPEPRDRSWWLLSLFAPADEDRVDWLRGSYALLDRRGRVESAAGWGIRKSRMRMIEEGAVIACVDEPVGSTRNVAPPDFPHPVYRFGVPLAIPLPAQVTS